MGAESASSRSASAERAGRLGLPEAGEPGLVVAPGAGVGGAAGEDRGKVADERDRHLDVTGPLVGGVDGVDHLGAVVAPEPEAEVERRPDDEDGVGFGLQERPGAVEGERVVGREAAAAHPVHEHGDAQRGGAGGQRRLAVGHVDVGAGHDGRSLGPGEDGGGPGHLVRVDLERRRRGDGPHLPAALAEDHVERQVDEHRAAVGADGLVDCSGHLLGDLVGGGDRPGQLGDRCHEGDVVELLQRPRAPAGLRGPAAQHHDGRPVEPGGGDGAHPVGDAGPGREGGQARTAPELCRPLGGEDGRLLVAGVDDAHACLHRRVEEREDVAPREREHLGDAGAEQGGEGQLAAVPAHADGGFCHWAPSRNDTTAVRHAVAFSRCGLWPASGTTSSLAPGIVAGQTSTIGQERCILRSDEDQGGYGKEVQPRQAVVLVQQGEGHRRVHRPRRAPQPPVPLGHQVGAVTAEPGRRRGLERVVGDTGEDVGQGADARRADQPGRPLGQRRVDRHRAVARVHQDEGLEPLRRIQGHDLGHHPAHRVAEEAEPVPAQPVGQRQHVGGEQVEGVVPLAVGLVALTVAPQVGRDHVPAGGGQGPDVVREVLLGPGEAVDEEQGSTPPARLGHDQRHLADGDADRGWHRRHSDTGVRSKGSSNGRQS